MISKFDASKECQHCRGSGIEFIAAGHGNINEEPCSICQPKSVLQSENDLLRAALEDIATDEREHGDDDLASYYRMKQTAERALNGEYAHEPVAVVITDNKLDEMATVEILTYPPTIEVGTKLYAKKRGAR